jgi:hypothetical protein
VKGFSPAVYAGHSEVCISERTVVMVLSKDLHWWLASLAAVTLVAACGASRGGDKDGKDSTKPRPKLEVQVAQELKQIGLGLHSYHDAYRCLPPAGPKAAPVVGGTLDPHLTPWRIGVLPFIEQDNLYKAILSGKYKGGQGGGEYWRNADLQKLCPALYAAGLDGAERTRTHYRVFVGNGAAFEPNRCLRLTDFKDGNSNTILVVEAGEAVPWTSTVELPFDPKKPLPKLGHPSRKGFHALMADGSVRYIPKNTDEKLIRAMITRNGGEEIKKLPGEKK